MLAFAVALAPVHQKYLLEARQMQALSFTVHIPLVCFGIAFPVMVMIVEWLGMRTGDPVYRTLAQRWSRIVLALFAVGVITGTILSFEMGLLWPQFTSTFGSVFGLGFAIEGFSFFLEAIFVGIYAYGWNKLSPRMHFLSGIPVVLTGFTGSLMVIAVNAWMNHPTGFQLHGGKVTHVNPLGALFGNPYLWSELIHMYVAAYMVTGFIVAGCYAYAKLRGNWTRYHRIALTVPLTIACLAAPMQLLVGDWIARDVAVSQPVKLAAFEGLYPTTDGASEHILGWYTGDQVKYGIGIPHLLSLLAFHSWNAKIVGLQSVSANDRPPAENLIRFSFQFMVLVGSALAALGVLYLLVRWRRGRLPDGVWFYRGVVVAGPAAFGCLIAGWITTEVGRQPWVVYDVMRTSQAVTGAGGIPVGYGALVAAYAAVAVAVAWILRRLAKKPLDLDPVGVIPTPGGPGPMPTTGPQAG
jgi:cytochrome bd ubiquinol oxidase subunit I